jgi:anaerobic ribonucleoside-triphosphate reductase
VIQLTNEIIDIADFRHPVELPAVEEIQNIVEEVLIKHEHDQVAKAYILYREKQNKTRMDRSVMLDVNKTMTEYLDQSDWRVNANANSGYSLGGLILNTS